MAAAACAMAATRASLRIGVCSNIKGLQPELERAFQASTKLAPCYELQTLDIADASSPGIGEVEVLLADPGKVVGCLDGFKKLRWLQSSWAGINALSGHARRDYTCTRLAGCFGQQMSEYVIGSIFEPDWMALRDYQEKGQWEAEPFLQRRRLNSMKMGLLGVGDIASVIAMRAQAFGMSTIGFASTARDVKGFEVVTTDLDRVLSEGDVIVNVLPSTPQTRGLLDNQKLAQCGEQKMFVNCGRGDVVSEASLLEALDNGWLRRAVLDVFKEEPLPESSGLWRHPSVRITPHIAAVSYASDVADLFVENLELWLEGHDLKYVVDLEKGY